MKRFVPLIIVSAYFLAHAYCLQAEERSKIPEKYKWKTEDIYPNDQTWHKKKDELATRLPELSKFQGRLGESSRMLYEASSTIFAMDQELDRLAIYASMRFDEDTRVAATSAMKQVSEDLIVKFGTITSYLRPEIIALGSEKVNRFIKSESRLSPYAPWLKDVLRYAPHTLSPAEEKVAAQASIMAEGAVHTYETFTNADLPYPEVVLSSGEKVRLNQSAYTKYREVPNREDRDKVFHVFWTKYKEFERTLGTTLDADVKTHIFDKEVHRFSSSLEAALFDSDIPASVYRQLILDVHNNLPTLHRYLKLRKRMMGFDQLRYEDLYAPIIKQVSLHYNIEQAKDLVLKAVAPLGQQYADDLRKGYENRWVDFLPSTGKKSGAYNTGVYGVHPYMLQNFTGIYDEVLTLAHESGHAMHSLLSDRTQPFPTHEYKIFVAEVASTLNENLLTHYMISHAPNKDARLYMLGEALERLRTTLFRQTMFAEFEWKIHELEEKGEPLTGEGLSGLYLKLVRDYYGHEAGICRVDDLYGIEWAFVPHFYRNFYVYQYATSIVASTQIAAEIRREAAQSSTKTRDAYLKMLSSGSSREPLDLLKSAGVDMTTSAPFNAAIKEMNDTMDEMEKLLASKT